MSKVVSFRRAKRTDISFILIAKVTKNQCLQYNVFYGNFKFRKILIWLILNLVDFKFEQRARGWLGKSAMRNRFISASALTVPAIEKSIGDLDDDFNESLW